MKNTLVKMIGILSIGSSAGVALATDQSITPETASYIEITAAEGHDEDLAQFLISAAPVVTENEPGTKLWFALKAENNRLAIFDIFEDADARSAHFAGSVAQALNVNADTLIRGGWNDGVVANINNSTVLSLKEKTDLHTAKTATYINIKAAAGQGDALADLLTAAGPIVADTEPDTLFWVALRLDTDNFAIFDIFADDSGRDAHFAGAVAGLLKAQSSVLVEGGWENGVVANIHNYEILAIN